MPSFIACTVCDGKNPQHCPECKGAGRRHHKIERCLCAEVPESTWQIIDFIGFADRGHLPVSGAVLDQTQSFWDAREFYRREVSLCRQTQGR